MHYFRSKSRSPRWGGDTPYPFVACGLWPLALAPSPLEKNPAGAMDTVTFDGDSFFVDCTTIRACV